MNPDNLKPRLPDEILYKLYKMRLLQNDCQNRGYILDGFPRTFKDAHSIFMLSQTQEGEEEEEEQKRPKVLNQSIVPQCCVFLTASDEDLIRKVT